MIKLYIGIDPGHAGWAIAYRAIFKDEPTPDFLKGTTIYHGKETQKGIIGCPELLAKLESIPKSVDRVIIGIEEPMTNPKLLSPLISLNRDIGYIAHAMREHSVLTIQASDWKMHLQKEIPELKGNMGATDKKVQKPIKGGFRHITEPVIVRGYQSLINEHYGVNLNPNECAAFGILKYLVDNQVE